MEISKQVTAAHERAIKALQNSHSPYSKLRVACALQTGEGVVTGVNVENASYGGTICAERSALVSAISQFSSKIDMQFLVVISDFVGESIPPCGLCLQFLKEFVGSDFPVYLGNDKKITKQYRFQELLPVSFSAEMLPESS